jgi:hypothetical protein
MKKKHPKVAQTPFVKINTLLLPWKKLAQKIWATSVIFNKTAQSIQ